VGVAVAAVGAAIAATALIQNQRSASSTRQVAAIVPRDDAAVTATTATTPIDAALASTPAVADAAVVGTALRGPRPDAGVRAAPRHRDAGVSMAASVDAAASSSSTATQDPAPKYWTESNLPTATAGDFNARIGWATERVHRIYPDAKLVHIGGGGLAPDGTIDLTNAAGWIEYTFRSPSHTPKTKLGGQMFECLVGIRIAMGTAQIGTSNSECNEPWFAARCSGKDLWRIAISRGAATGRVAGVYLYPSETGHLWKLRPDEHYDIEDSECPR
jgi:hypothetical protein